MRNKASLYGYRCGLQFVEKINCGYISNPLCVDNYQIVHAMHTLNLLCHVKDCAFPLGPENLHQGYTF